MRTVRISFIRFPLIFDYQKNDDKSYTMKRQTDRRIFSNMSFQ